jgi:hypothetical protein
MPRKKRWLWGLLGSLVLLFGLGCLNYTEAWGLEHHRAVAERHHLPPPSKTIFLTGVAAVVVGATMVGFVLGRGRVMQAPLPSPASVAQAKDEEPR